MDSLMVNNFKIMIQPHSHLKKNVWATLVPF